MEETLDSREQFLDMSDTKPSKRIMQLEDDELDLSS